jgi:hypothetical protein
MKNFIDWIQQEHDVTLTDNFNQFFDLGFMTLDTRDGYEVFGIVNYNYQLEGGIGESIIQEEHCLYDIIAEEIKSREGATIYLENLEEWIEYIADEFPDFDEDEDEDEDWDEE